MTREFNYFRQTNEEIHAQIKTPDTPYSIEPIEVDTYPIILSFLDFHPSWQNSMESIKRSADNFISLGAFLAKQLVGYCIFEPAPGDLTQIGVDRLHRRKGIASLLLREMIRLNQNDIVKVINTDIACSSITGFLHAKKYRTTRETI